MPLPPAEYVRRPRTTLNLLDRLIGSDPGLGRLRLALLVVVTVGVAMLAELIFVRTTGAIQAPFPSSASRPEIIQVAAFNHAVLIIALILGAIAGMMAGFGASMFARPHHQLIEILLLPVPLVAGLSLGLVVGVDRVLSLMALTLVLALGAYCRRFGPAGLMGGVVAFMGVFFGFLLRPEIGPQDLGWLTLEILIGAGVALAAQFTLFYPSRTASLRRMMRSYEARAGDVTRRSRALFEMSSGPEQSSVRARAATALQRRLVRLNEAALMIDGQLSDPAALSPGRSAARVHQTVFDVELALTNIAHSSDRLGQSPLPPEVQQLVRRCLAAIDDRDLECADAVANDILDQLSRGQTRQEPSPWAGETAVNAGSPQTPPPPLTESGEQQSANSMYVEIQPDRGNRKPAPLELEPIDEVVLRRFATSVADLVAASQAWRREPTAFAWTAGTDAPSVKDEAAFETSVELFGGWLPGSATVSAAASLEAAPYGSGWDKVRLPPYVRVTIQMGVAVAGASVLGSLISERRFYWAVIAAFVTFIGANNAGEQLRKGFNRVAGTTIGVVFGAIGTHLVAGRAALSVLVILASLFVGLYLMRVSYLFMVIGITILVSQMYVQVGEFSNALLLLRMEETAVGAACAALTVLFVLPLRTERVIRFATGQFVEAIAVLAQTAVNRLLDPAEPLAAIRGAARGLDAALQALLATARNSQISLPWFVSPGDPTRTQLLHTAAAAQHHARNLVIDTAGPLRLTADQRRRLRVASVRLSTSMTVLLKAQRSGGHRSPGSPGAYVRSESLFARVDVRTGHPHSAPPRTNVLHYALGELRLLDGALADLAAISQLQVMSLDADPDAAPGSPGHPA